VVSGTAPLVSVLIASRRPLGPCLPVDRIVSSEGFILVETGRQDRDIAGHPRREGGRIDGPEPVLLVPSPGLRRRAGARQRQDRKVADLR